MKLWMLGLGAWTASLGMGVADARAQVAAREVRKDQAAVVLDGVVREVFVSPRANRVDVLVVLEVRRAELGPGDRRGAVVDVPAPGELAYIHSFMTQGGAGASYKALPPERGQIRAYLVPDGSGGWAGTYPDWFDATSRDLVAARAGDPEPPAGGGAMPAGEQPADIGKPRILGLVADPVSVGGRVALKITEVMPGSPAQAAGLEAGDVIVDANGAATSSPEQLAAAVRKSGNILKLTIRNVRTGENVPVNVDLGGGER